MTESGHLSFCRRGQKPAQLYSNSGGPMRTHAAWLLTVLLVAASLAAFPQTSARITLNVVAFDSHDQIVGDLTSRDFQVSDQGKPQRIVSFHRNADSQAPPVVILADGGFGTEGIKRWNS